MKILLLRHTRPDIPEGLCYGVTDVPLAPGLEAEAKRLRAELGDAERLVVSSPLSRCIQLAVTLSPVVHVDQRLREYDFGDWDGRPWDSLPRPEVEAWCADLVYARPPGGEIFVELQLRAVAALMDAVVLADGAPLLLCTHAGVIRALLAYVRGLSLEEALGLPVPYGSLHALEAANLVSEARMGGYLS